MATKQNEEVDKFVRGISKYISHVFETGNVPVFFEREYTPSESLRILLNRCINHLKKYIESHSVEYIFYDDRITILQNILKSIFEVAAQQMPPLDFLTRCAIYIIGGSHLKQHGFVEAPDIICDAIYEAFVESEQHHYLRPWFYVEKLKPPIVCTISNDMPITKLERDRVDKFSRGICKYVSCKYETDTAPVYSEKEYAISESLTIFLNRCINHHRNYFKVHQYDADLSDDDRIDTLLTKYILNLRKAALMSEHLVFLNECATYFIFGSSLKQRGFLEAPDIACVAIYQALIDSDQHKYLRPWFYDFEKSKTPTE